jgi:hypothetical protein
MTIIIDVDANDEWKCDKVARVKCNAMQCNAMQ